MKYLLAITILIFASTPARADYSCEALRWAHQTYGTAQLLQWARKYRITPAQRRAAIACLRLSR